MAYSNVPIGTSNPGCIVILVDGGGLGRRNEAKGTTLVVNRILAEGTTPK